mgnify:CR=1 FL=1
MAQVLLKVKGLKVAYGGIQAVKGIDLEVREGELVALIGANGAGKTTTLKAITGALPLAGGDPVSLQFIPPPGAGKKLNLPGAPVAGVFRFPNAMSRHISGEPAAMRVKSRKPLAAY